MRVVLYQRTLRPSLHPPCLVTVVTAQIMFTRSEGTWRSRRSTSYCAVAERAAARAAHGCKLSIAVGQRQIEAREQRRRGREEVGELLKRRNDIVLQTKTLNFGNHRQPHDVTYTHPPSREAASDSPAYTLYPPTLSPSPYPPPVPNPAQTKIIRDCNRPGSRVI